MQVQAWVTACRDCQARKPAWFWRRSPLQVLVQEEPWARVVMDLMGPLPETPCHNQHVLVMADNFTKWVEAFPIPDMLAVTAAEVLVREVV